MVDNKQVKTFLTAAGILALGALLTFPTVKGKINEFRKKNVSLEQEQSLGTWEDVEVQKEREQQKEENAQDTVAVEQDKEAAGEEKELPEMIWRLEDGSLEIKFSLWQSENGICYFFLPGFVRDMGLVLEKTDGGEIYIGNSRLKEGDVLKNISEGEAYELALYGRDGELMLEEPVIFMYSSDLPVLMLTTYSGSMEYIDENKENEEAGEVVLFDEKGIKLYAGEAESIGGRGNSTWGLSKKPYQFKLCEKVDFFGFGESRSWNLIANGYDETRLRNEIAMELAKALGMDYVPEGQMIDLYVNDIYYGNYYLTEKIRVGSEMVDIRDMETVLDSIYSPEELERLERLETEDGDRKWVENGYDETDFSGGYLLERELPSRFEETISGFITNQGDCYALQSPAYASKEQVDYIADLMQEFQDAAAESSGMHPVTGKHYSEYIDVTSFVQKYLVEEISKNYDGGVTSSFFYKPQTAVSNKIFAGPVWDYDVAFGNCNLDEIASNPAGITKMNDHIYGTNLFALLYEKEDFYKGIQTLYEEKALPFLEKLLDTGIDEMVKESRASAEMDSIRWEELENRYQYYEEYDNSVRYLKWFISKRMDFLNEVWLEGVVYHNVSFMVDDEAWQIACVKDGETVENEPIPSRYSSVFMGWTTKAGVPFDRFKPVYEDMVFYARWQELDVEDVVLK
ncbi:CotH kinase family protein [Parablautia muri]|uniref:CotH protein n=1 Tax=Parablautia muri TaxID=2320879 RepID=A0A9X5BCQ3_9FIRM|nr:hypothetical protein [Parablautia muri]